MHDEIDYEADTDRRRPQKSTRARSARVSKTSRRRKKVSTAIGGSHQRRNKHWSW